LIRKPQGKQAANKDILITVGKSVGKSVVGKGVVLLRLKKMRGYDIRMARIKISFLNLLLVLTAFV